MLWVVMDASALVTLHELEEARDRLLAMIVSDLRGDDRVGAVWLAGSLGRGEADAWSDLDLHVIVHEQDMPAVLGDRAIWYECWGPPILVQPEIPANAAPGGSFQLVLFPDGVELDLLVEPASTAVRSPHNRLLFDRIDVPLLRATPLDEDGWRRRAEDRLIFFWAMAPIAAKYASRGTTWKLVRMIDLLRDAYIDVWNLLNGPPESLLPSNLTNAPMVPRLAEQLPEVPAQITPLSGLAVVRAMANDVADWHGALIERGVDVPTAMPGMVEQFMKMAERNMFSLGQSSSDANDQD